MAEQKGLKFGKAVTREQLPFVTADELAKLKSFTIFGARLFSSGKYGPQWYFDVAWKQDNKVEKGTISLTQNADRDEIAALVRKHEALTNVALEVRTTFTGNPYFHFIDADDKDKPEALRNDKKESDLPKDDDIPF